MADLKREAIDDPKQPRSVRGWLRNERRQRGNSPYKWRNPPGMDAGHPNDMPWVTHGDQGKLKFEWAADNRSKGKYAKEQKRRLERNDDTE